LEQKQNGGEERNGCLLMRALNILRWGLYGAGGFGVNQFVSSNLGFLSFSSGASMEPTISSSGDVVVVDTRGVKDGTRSFQRGQIVAAKSPIEPSKLIMKRILAMVWKAALLSSSPRPTSPD